VIDKLEDHRLPVRHDGTLRLSTGRNVHDTAWKNKEMSWSVLLKKLSESVQTPETHAEYMKLGKPDQDKIKDIGGFVGGSLKGGRRKASAVKDRQLITLDADNAPADLLTSLDVYLDCAYAVYSTHKHTPERPRYRIVIVLSRPVSPDEYEAVARKLADHIGIDYFDDTTYEPNRMMFWPSHPCDVAPTFQYNDAPWLDPDTILAEYPDWTDISYWPESSRTIEKRKKTLDKQEDPRQKDGVIGAFCRAYDIHDAISTFLSDAYVPCGNDPDRYTYTEGSTSGGLVVYEDGRFAYSHHATDPISGTLRNAFDLVRIHKFGELDAEARAGTATTKLPSYKAMIGLCDRDARTRQVLWGENRKKAFEAFTEADEDSEDGEGSGADPEEETEEDLSWMTGLEIRNGKRTASLNNARWILQHDPQLKGIVFNQLAGNLEITGKVPWKKQGKFWRDADDAQLENYLAGAYAEFPKAKILSAITKVADDRSYHPIRQYLESLPEWDGTPRVDTLLIDYLGAEDNSYVRAVTRKTLCAAVRRVQVPGIKFDTVLVCCGPQGIGKSTLWARMGGPWFSDSLNLQDTRDKTAAEKLQGVWIVEIQELAGIGSAGVKTLRSFITTQNDRYRASYGRIVSDHPRQCILIGTTNSEDGYLNDVEGGRRFWPVNTPGGDILRPWDLTEEDVQQIWAEVLVMTEKGESLILSEADAEMATVMQQKAVIADPREELVRDYLDRKLPTDWYSWSISKRRDFLYDEDTPEPKVWIRRRYVCAQEIWVECFGRRMQDMRPTDTYEIRRIMMKMEGWNGQSVRRRIGGEYGRQRAFTRKEMAGTTSAGMA